MPSRGAKIKWGRGVTATPPIIAALSPARWEGFARGVDDEAALARYIWNIQLCEALYPVLHLLEVGLRNGLHREITAHFGRDDWFDMGWLDRPQAEDIQKAREALERQRREPTPDRIVSEVTFGFWCGLFNRHYERSHVLWPALIKPVFPCLPKGMRGIRDIERNINQMRRLRNRVFHHEPIWHWRDLRQKHDIGTRLVKGLEPELGDQLETIDRFQDILKQRPA